MENSEVLEWVFSFLKRKSLLPFLARDFLKTINSCLWLVLFFAHFVTGERLKSVWNKMVYAVYCHAP